MNKKQNNSEYAVKPGEDSSVYTKKRRKKLILLGVGIVGFVLLLIIGVYSKVLPNPFILGSKPTAHPVNTPSTKTATPVPATSTPAPTATPLPTPTVAPVKETVLFDFDKYILKNEQINKVSSFYNTYDKNGTVKIDGYADIVGTEGYNKELSQKRAQTVADFLIKNGFPKDNILTIQGNGVANPVADNSTEEGRAKNRRVEIEFLPQK